MILMLHLCSIIEQVGKMFHHYHKLIYKKSNNYKLANNSTYTYRYVSAKHLASYLPMVQVFGLV